MPNTQILIDILDEEIRLFDEIADNVGVSREAVIRKALTEYLASYEQEKEETRQAIEEFEAGNSLSHEDVMKQFSDRLRRDQAA